ncbi:MAG TPA: N,N-dimethylformamidase beta subunit family domain-containing protein [Acidimicrobiales bacterium]
MSSPFTRRTFLGGLGAGASALLLSNAAEAAESPRPLAFPTTAYASWVRQENQRAGDGTWLDGVPAPAGNLEGFASATSTPLGGTVTFALSAGAPHVRAKIFRMGYYGGLGARLVEVRERIATTSRPVPRADAFGTVDCDWPPSFSLKLDARYLPGQYLVRLENPEGQYRFVPFLVRDDLSRATYVYLSAVTTWQAYNAWGGYSLYREADSTGARTISNAARAVRVSFNRPYDANFANGAGDFIGNEFPLLFLLEQLNLDLAYWTDIDLHERGPALQRHRALLSLGHDEYYSPAMRNALTKALDAGVNVAFFGANFAYRKIRFEPSYHGSTRLVVNYRSSADPIGASNPSAVTVNWGSYPLNQPESTFSGSIYGGAQGAGSMTVLGAGGWLWRGTHLRTGASLPNALGGEFNHVALPEPVLAPVQIFAQSAVLGGTSNVTYYAPPGRGGVFCSGTGYWIYRLSNAPLLGNEWVPPPIDGVTGPLSVATRNVLALFARGPAGNREPSRS